MIGYISVLSPLLSKILVAPLTHQLFHAIWGEWFDCF